MEYSDAELFETRVPLKGVWWKYGLVFAGLQLAAWALLIASRRNPDVDLMFVLTYSRTIYASFIIAGFAPFVFGRLGLSRLMKWTAAGVLLGLVSYYLLSLYEPTSRLNLLPFTAFLQLSAAGFMIGAVWELGRYVFSKLKE